LNYNNETDDYDKLKMLTSIESDLVLLENELSSSSETQIVCFFLNLLF
jgi:hypothetical protein